MKVNEKRTDEEAREIGSRIKKLRLIRGIEQDDLANRARVSQSMISKIESGSATPSLKALKRIANALGVAYEDVFAPHSKLVPLNDKITMNHLDDNLRQFIAKEESVPYIMAGKELQERGLSKEELEALVSVFTSRKKK